MKNNKLTKSKSVIKFKEFDPKERPFSIEKIAKSINCGSLINSIKYKYIDPKIKRKKDIHKNESKKSKKIQDKLDEEIYSARKIRYHKYINLKEINSSPISSRELGRNNNSLKLKNREFKLPLIIKNKKINESYREIKKEEKDLLSTSGMINSKRLSDNKKKKITIGALVNIMRNKNNKLKKEEDYKSFDDVYNTNIRKNLNLNIKNSYNYNRKNKFMRKLTKAGLLTNLYQKYSSVNNNKDNFNKINEIKSESKDCSSNVSFDLGKEISKINNNVGEKIFLTKIKSNNYNLDISKIINRYNNYILSIKKNNYKRLDINNKIYINCLLSKVQTELDIDKIVYKKNGKTIYELDKELSYKRLKKFENIINRLYIKNY